MEIEYISLPKLKQEIRRADLTGHQVFLCCMTRPAVLVDQMYKMQGSSDNDRLDHVRRKLPIRIPKRAGLYDRETAEFGDLARHRLRSDHRYASVPSVPWHTELKALLKSMNSE